MALSQPDRDILRRAQAGDDRAFAIILRQYHAPIYNYAVRVLSGDRALAEDVCQEIFVRVHRALPRFDDRSLFTTWLFQIAKNRLVDEMRSRERRIRPAVELDRSGRWGWQRRCRFTRSRTWTSCGGRSVRSAPT